MQKYQVIYADPAWQYGSKELYGDKTKGSDKRENRFRTIERIYTTMTINDIKNLKVKEIIDKTNTLETHEESAINRAYHRGHMDAEKNKNPKNNYYKEEHKVNSFFRNRIVKI